MKESAYNVVVVGGGKAALCVAGSVFGRIAGREAGAFASSTSNQGVST